MILDQHRERMRRYLVIAEGLRLKPYTDTVGKLTIGIGRNLTDVGISAREAYDLLDHDLDRAIAQVVARFPWIDEQDEVRQAVLTELMFQMGPDTLKQFVNTLAAFRMKDYVAAAEGLKKSKWYRQTQKARTERIISMTLTGQWS